MSKVYTVAIETQSGLKINYEETVTLETLEETESMEEILYEIAVMNYGLNNDDSVIILEK